MKYLILILALFFSGFQGNEPKSFKTTNKETKPEYFTLNKLDTSEILMKLYDGVKINSRKEVDYLPVNEDTLGADSNGYKQACLHSLIIYDVKKVPNAIALTRRSTFGQGIPHGAGGTFYASHFTMNKNKWVCDDKMHLLGDYGEWGGDSVKAEVESFGKDIYFLKIVAGW